MLCKTPPHRSMRAGPNNSLQDNHAQLHTCSQLRADRQLHDAAQQPAVTRGVVGMPFNVSVPDPRLWSPNNPYLYTVFATLYPPTYSSAQSEVRPLSAHLNMHFPFRRLFPGTHDTTAHVSALTCKFCSQGFFLLHLGCDVQPCWRHALLQAGRLRPHSTKSFRLLQWCPVQASEQPPTLDRVRGYMGMRKIALCTDGPESPQRICLNNQRILQIGLLDQVRPCILALGCVSPWQPACLHATGASLSRSNRCQEIVNVRSNAARTRIRPGS